MENYKVNDKVKDKAKSVERVPLHRQNVLMGDKRPGFKRMWVNESVGNVEAYRLAGWELVIDSKMKTHDSLSQVESQFDSVVRRVVNKDPFAPYKTAVLMEIPIEIYEEDQRAEQALIDEAEKQYKKLKPQEYGEVTFS